VLNNVSPAPYGKNAAKNATQEISGVALQSAYEIMSWMKGMTLN
jgi:hypothetical protein